MAKPLRKPTGTPLQRAFGRVAGVLDRRLGWDKLPLPLGLAVLIGIRYVLREKNLYDTGGPPGARDAGLPPAEQLLRTPPAGPDGAAPVAPPRADSPAAGSVRHLTARTADGTYNDLSRPTMGSAGMRFGRNVPLRYTHQEAPEQILRPNPRVVSR
jgi:hypothetical protein